MNMKERDRLLGMLSVRGRELYLSSPGFRWMVDHVAEWSHDKQLFALLNLTAGYCEATDAAREKREPRGEPVPLAQCN